MNHKMHHSYDIRAIDPSVAETEIFPDIQPKAADALAPCVT